MTPLTGGVQSLMKGVGSTTPVRVVESPRQIVSWVAVVPVKSGVVPT